MAEILKLLVKLMAKIHNVILYYFGTYLHITSDKWLHFIVIGCLGMGLVAIIYPLFKELARNNKIMTITWIYVFTMLVVITFAIEIGQKITNTGNMEFADIAAGLLGFLTMFVAMLLIWGIVTLIKRKFNKE